MTDNKNIKDLFEEIEEVDLEDLNQELNCACSSASDNPY